MDVPREALTSCEIDQAKASLHRFSSSFVRSSDSKDKNKVTSRAVEIHLRGRYVAVLTGNAEEAMDIGCGVNGLILTTRYLHCLRIATND